MMPSTNGAFHGSRTNLAAYTVVITTIASTISGAAAWWLTKDANALLDSFRRQTEEQLQARILDLKQEIEREVAWRDEQRIDHESRIRQLETDINRRTNELATRVEVLERHIYGVRPAMPYNSSKAMDLP